MSQPFDSCRLYFALRYKAWARPGPERKPGTMARGLVDVGDDLEGPGEVEFDRAEARAAMNDLLETDLVHWLTPEQERELGIEHHEGANFLFVKLLDDLTAATILMSQS